MKTLWTKSCKDDAEKKRLRSEFARGKLLRERLCQILEEKIQSEQRAARSKEAYNEANWAYRQADSQGYQRALSEIIGLLLK